MQTHFSQQCIAAKKCFSSFIALSLLATPTFDFHVHFFVIKALENVANGPTISAFENSKTTFKEHHLKLLGGEGHGYE